MLQCFVGSIKYLKFGFVFFKQGRLDPVETHLKNNKRGLGADKVKKKAIKPLDIATASSDKHDQVNFICFCSNIS